MSDSDRHGVYESLHEQVQTALRLLAEEQYLALVATYGYGVSLGRDPAIAVRDDLQSALRSVGATALSSRARAEVEVDSFNPQGTGIETVVTCSIPTNGEGEVLVEFTVGAGRSNQVLSLEQVSAS